MDSAFAPEHSAQGEGAGEGAAQRPPMVTTERPALLLVILLAVFGLLLFQAITYSGLMERLAEWQFWRFGRYFPALTLALILLIPALIIGAIAFPVRRRQVRREGMDERYVRELLSLHRWKRVFSISTIVAVVLAFGTFGHFLRMPDGSGPIRTAHFGSGPVTLHNGRMMIGGMRLVGPIAFYAEDLMFLRHTVYLAPIGSVRTSDGTTINAFAEITEQEAEDRSIWGRRDGVVRRQAMPPEVVSMYRGAGYAVSGNSAVLFQSSWTARRGILVLMGEFVVMALLAFAAILFLRRSEKRLHEKYGQSDDEGLIATE